MVKLTYENVYHLTFGLQSLKKLMAHADNPISHGFQLNCPFCIHVPARIFMSFRMSGIRVTMWALAKDFEVIIWLVYKDNKEFPSNSADEQEKYPSLSIAATIDAPWIGGLEYMGLMTNFNWLSTLDATSALLHTCGPNEDSSSFDKWVKWI